MNQFFPVLSIPVNFVFSLKLNLYRALLSLFPFTSFLLTQKISELFRRTDHATSVSVWLAAPHQSPQNVIHKTWLPTDCFNPVSIIFQTFKTSSKPGGAPLTSIARK